MANVLEGGLLVPGWNLGRLIVIALTENYFMVAMFSPFGC
jgi:hypothetical protein